MEKCKYCGFEISLDSDGFAKRGYCDGVLTLGTDPFQEEIYNNFEVTWDCAGNRYQSAMDI